MFPNKMFMNSTYREKSRKRHFCFVKTEKRNLFWSAEVRGMRLGLLPPPVNFFGETNPWPIFFEVIDITWGMPIPWELSG